MKTPFWTAAVILLVSALPVRCADWNPRLAADYLDGRQKDWSAWPVAKSAGGTCVSCHTGLTYLMARPALRKVLGEAQPTQYEVGLIDGMKERTVKNERMFGAARFAEGPLASQAAGVQSILTALLLARSDRDGTMSPATEQALERMWAAQIHEGPSKGGWAWFQFDDDPYETEQSAYYGATLAALAVGAAPAAYREKSDVKAHLDELAHYLQTAKEGQPLHNRLMLLWVSAAIPDLWPKAACQKLIDEVLAKQQPDGGWTMDSLGPWKEHPAAAASSGSNSYATAVAALALEQAGLKISDTGLAKALVWLQSRQNPAGYWDAISMNKRYAAGSMQELFILKRAVRRGHRRGDQCFR